MMNDVIKEFVKALTIPLENNFLGWFLISLLWLCVLMIVGLIVWGILEAINSWFTPVVEGYVKIVAMRFEAAHYSTTLMYNAATKTSTPVTTWHPNAWKLVIEVDGMSGDFYLSKEKYMKWHVEDKIYVNYTKGRLWKSIIIKNARV